MKTFKGKDYEKERLALLDTVRDYRAKRDECSVSLGECTESLQSELSILQSLMSQISTEVDDIFADKAECESDLNKVDNQIYTLTKKIDLLKAHEYDPNCEYCCNNEFVKEANEAKLELPTLENDRLIIIRKIDDLNEKTDKDQYSKARNYVDNFDKRKSKVTELKLKLSKIELEKEKNLSELSTQNQLLSDLNLNLEAAKKASDPIMVKNIEKLKTSVETIKTQREEHQSQLSKLATKIGVYQEKLAIAGDLLNVGQEWKKWFPV